jgi:hypothetical protein
MLVAMALLTPTQVFADESEVQRWNSSDSMGCMILRECKKGVTRVKNWKELSATSGATTGDYTIENEADIIIINLNALDIPVYVAESMYFPHNVTGLYDVRSNQMFLNKRYMKDTNRLIKTLRHEGWHAVQDCMAGSLDNTFIAIVHSEEKVPSLWKEIVAKTYPESARVWEAEAKWMGTQLGETAYALQMCRQKPLWEVYEPTPMTREWLEKEGFIK